MSKSQYDKTSAEPIFTGFDYQYYYFLYEILNLAEKNEEIGLEKKDDVHIQIGKKLILVQLKHTTQIYKNGKTINLTTRDKDLWHTIHNWLSFIKDKECGGGKTITEQKKYIKNTTFQLVTNKSYSDDNTFLVNFSLFKKEEIQIEVFKKYLQELFEKTEDKKIKTYIKELINFNKKTLKLFLEKIEVETNFDDLIERIKERLKYKKSIEQRDIEGVFSSLDSSLRAKNFKDVKDGQKITITSEAFYKEFTRCFNIGRSPNLPIRKIEYYKFPEIPVEQVFIKQLIDIGDVKPENESDIKNLTNYKLELMNNMQGWINEHDLVKEDIDDFRKESMIEWDNSFRAVKIESEEINEDTDISKEKKNKELKKLARKCVSEVRKVDLKIGAREKSPLSRSQSNGQFYYLSDENPKIGWIYNWQEKYT